MDDSFRLDLFSSDHFLQHGQQDQIVPLGQVNITNIPQFAIPELWKYAAHSSEPGRPGDEWGEQLWHHAAQIGA